MKNSDNTKKTQNSENNPVPSLDNQDIENIMKGLEYYKSGYSCDDKFQSTVHKTISKLQNGVETDKQQPKTFEKSDCYYHGGNCNCSLREMGSYPECK